MKAVMFCLLAVAMVVYSSPILNSNPAIVINQDRVMHGLLCSVCHDLFKDAENAGKSYGGVSWLNAQIPIFCDKTSLLKHECTKEFEKRDTEIDAKIKAGKDSVDACAELDFC